MVNTSLYVVLFVGRENNNFLVNSTSVNNCSISAMLGLISFRKILYFNYLFIVPNIAELLLNGRPTFIWRPASKVPEKFSYTLKVSYAPIKTSIQSLPILSSRSQLLAVTRMFCVCFIPLLNCQKDLKLEVFCQTKVKESAQCGNVFC